MKYLLLVTTQSDTSAPLFMSKDTARSITSITAYYDQDHLSLEAVIKDRTFDFVYFRDPFNGANYNIEAIDAIIKTVLTMQPHARYVDQAKTLDDMLFEDKLIQYKIFEDFMPRTELLLNKSQFETGKNIIKKRISARARDIAFEFNTKYLGGDYIVQPLLDIRQEYRVYCMSGAVIAEATTRSSKTPDTKVKIQAEIRLPVAVMDFAEKISGQLAKYDLVGLDIVVTKDGQLFLIEANRSCQFMAFARLTGINLAKKLAENLVA